VETNASKSCFLHDRPELVSIESAWVDGITKQSSEGQAMVMPCSPYFQSLLGLVRTSSNKGLTCQWSQRDPTSTMSRLGVGNNKIAVDTLQVPADLQVSLSQVDVLQ
jgi:hypothetical protein